MPVRFRKISTQIFLAQLVILTASMAVGFVLFTQEARSNLDHEYQARAAAIAQTFAQMPTVRACMASVPVGDACAASMQHLATSTSQSTGASFVVVIGMDRTRYTHPDPALIGKKVSESIVTVDGKTHLRVDPGATGVSANARVPLYAPGGAMAGEVSVGLRESSVSSDLLAELPAYAVWLVVALGLGAIASWLLARRMKKRTFGLELDEIAHLLQEREATLHGIREGVIAIDPDGRVSVINDEARRLLGLSGVPLRGRHEDVLPPGRVRDVLLGEPVGEGGAEDEIVVTDDFRLVVSRMPVVLNGRPHGSVVTVRDRTEVEALALELTGTRSLTESLRAQQHEFSNRMHAIAGLLELGRLPEALSYVHEIRGTSADLDETLRAHIAAPQLIGLLLGKAAEAGERGIDFVISPDTRVGEVPERVQALTTIVGNLVDNAFDAVAAVPAPRRVELGIVESADAVTVRVADSGPGVDEAIAPHLFETGTTTKAADLAGHSGIGLALVHAAATQAGGTVSVTTGPGAIFTVVLPRPVARPTMELPDRTESTERAKSADSPESADRRDSADRPESAERAEPTDPTEEP